MGFGSAVRARAVTAQNQPAAEGASRRKAACVFSGLGQIHSGFHAIYSKRGGRNLQWVDSAQFTANVGEFKADSTDFFCSARYFTSGRSSLNLHRVRCNLGGLFSLPSFLFVCRSILLRLPSSHLWRTAKKLDRQKRRHDRNSTALESITEPILSVPSSRSIERQRYSHTHSAQWEPAHQHSLLRIRLRRLPWSGPSSATARRSKRSGARSVRDLSPLDPHWRCQHFLI